MWADFCSTGPSQTSWCTRSQEALAHWATNPAQDTRCIHRNIVDRSMILWPKQQGQIQVCPKHPKTISYGRHVWCIFSTKQHNVRDSRVLVHLLPWSACQRACCPAARDASSSTDSGDKSPEKLKLNLSTLQQQSETIIDVVQFARPESSGAWHQGRNVLGYAGYVLRVRRVWFTESVHRWSMAKLVTGRAFFAIWDFLPHGHCTSPKSMVAGVRLTVQVPAQLAINWATVAGRWGGSFKHLKNPEVSSVTVSSDVEIPRVVDRAQG